MTRPPNRRALDRNGLRGRVQLYATIFRGLARRMNARAGLNLRIYVRRKNRCGSVIVNEGDSTETIKLEMRNRLASDGFEISDNRCAIACDAINELLLLKSRDFVADFHGSSRVMHSAIGPSIPDVLERSPPRIQVKVRIAKVASQNRRARILRGTMERLIRSSDLGNPLF